MTVGLIGKKKGMTRLYDDRGCATPVTVIEAGGNWVLQVKTLEKDGYTAFQVGFDDQKKQRVTQAQLGHFSKSASAPKRTIREFRTNLGEIAPSLGSLPVTHFQVDQFVDIVGQSKGKGFQGVVKRHGFSGQPASHGSMMHRRSGAIGNRSTPGRVWKNIGMPGHMGSKRTTVQNLRVIQVREKDGVILVRGAIPGPIGGYILILPSKKKGGSVRYFSNG
ncbi:MAG: 50S ribosomal protein L3 [Candidatus Xiphinematobacter sp.]|nr:MAG: 50S ribosomal protein L3 [Candidatus Xiphinematobacter sp.]QQY08666.1 MAG: 50S ribosomal protein L3 [Candidatus Xiphinematobacter sp.]